MRAISSFLVLLITPLILVPASAERQLRELAGFDSVHVSSGIELDLRQGETFRVEVDAPADELDAIVTEVRGGRLEIRRERREPSGLFARFFDSGSGGSVFVTLPRLDSLHASSGARVRSDGRISGDVLDISASSGSSVSLDVAVARLGVETSSGSQVDLSGTAGRVRMDSSSGSGIDAVELSADAAELSASSGSDVDITVQGSLAARASSGSDITYRGSPASIDLDASSGGDVRAR